MMSRSVLWRASLFLALPASLAIASESNAHAQRATAAVAERVDVSGDGRADEVRIDEDGSITVHITGDDGAGAWTPLAASGKVIGGSIQVDTTLTPSKTIILATSDLGRRGGRTFTEAVALAWSPGRLETLWRGKLGAQGADGASSLRIELGPYGLILYSSRTGVSRCDGATPHLDAKRYDFASGRFRPAQQALRMAVADTRPALVASKRIPDTVPETAEAFWFRAAAASSSSRAASAAELVAPLALTDGKDDTAWVENKGGVGAGEFVTLRSSVGAVQVEAIRLALGHGASRSAYGRPKRLGLILSASEMFWIDIPKDPRTPLWVSLPKPTPSACVSLVLDTAYPRKPLAHTAISEVTVFSSEELDPRTSAELLATRIAEGKSGADTRRLLAKLGARASSALLSAISKTLRSDSPSKARQLTNLRLALASIPAAPVELVAGLADERLRDRHYAAFSKALLKLGSESIAPLTQTLLGSALSPAATGRIGAVLAALPQRGAADALLGALGNGSQATRFQIVKALAARANAWRELPSANAPENTATTQADLYRAMGLAGEKLPAGSKERAALGASIGAAVTLPSLGYEEHYRALAAAGQIGGNDAADALMAALQSLRERDDAEGLALLRRAAASLARLGGSTSGEHTTRRAEALGAALQHTDPGVRLAVITSLAPENSSDDDVAGALAADRWPEVRRAAAATLATRCTESNLAALEAALRKDDNGDVARSAFAGFLGCEPAGAFAVALAVVDDAKRPLGLRLHAARTLGLLARGDEASQVLRHFAKARRMALSSRASGKIAAALSRSLGDLGTPDAVSALEQSAADPAFPSLQAAALTVLGELCPASSQRLLRRLQDSGEHSVSAAATMAARQCSNR